MDCDKYNIAVIGLGYVGLPLLCLLSKKHPCVGVEINEIRIKEILNGIDSNQTVPQKFLGNLKITNKIDDVSSCNFIIVAVPTPVDKDDKPDLSPIERVCSEIGTILKPQDIIIFESTIFPGATEEICVPLLEKVSGYKNNKDFFVGYSPERVNIGDKVHTTNTIPKIIASSNKESLNRIVDLYKSIIDAPIIKASSIKVAEAAKIYENVQRDVLISLANQFSEYCRLENIDIQEVTKCASTKWNFSTVIPGLVGGHCIGVDPYYLIKRAKDKDFDFSLVKMARTINEEKCRIVENRIMEILENVNFESPRLLILGFSYKPNTPDFRNSKVATIINGLTKKHIHVDCYDPLTKAEEVKKEYGIELLSDLDNKKYNLVILAVQHEALTHVSIEEHLLEDGKFYKLEDLL